MLIILTVSNLIPLESVDLLSSCVMEFPAKSISPEHVCRVNSWFSAELNCSVICCRTCPDCLIRWAKERGLEFLGTVLESQAKRFLRELKAAIAAV